MCEGKINKLTSEAMGRMWRVHAVGQNGVGLLIVEGITTASVCWFFHQVFTY